MKPADYRCECKTIRTIYVYDTENFPKEIPCYACGKKAKRMYTALYSICHQGKAGNSKNGYTSNPVKILKT